MSPVDASSVHIQAHLHQRWLHELLYLKRDDIQGMVLIRSEQDHPNTICGLRTALDGVVVVTWSRQ